MNNKTSSIKLYQNEYSLVQDPLLLDNTLFPDATLLPKDLKKAHCREDSRRIHQDEELERLQKS